MSDNPTKQILVTCCADCPFNMTCKAWKSLSSKDKVYLTLSSAVPHDFMLAKCHLDDAPTSGKGE